MSYQASLKTEFRNTLYSDAMVYEVINKQFGPCASRLFELLTNGRAAILNDKASTDILNAMQDIYKA